MKRIKIFLLLFLCFITIPFIRINAVDLNNYDDITKEIDSLQRIFNDIKKATDTNEKTLNDLRKRVDNIKFKINNLEDEIVRKEKEVKEGEEALDYKKKLLFERVRLYYKNINKYSNSLINLFLAENLSVSLRNFFYQKSLVDEDRNMIIKIVTYVKNLEEKKASLQSEKDQLAKIKQDVEKQSDFLAGEVSKAKNYQSELSTKIAQLSTRQQELIAQRQAGLNLPKSAGTSAGGCVDDRGIDPGFSPAFAFFTYGSVHRVGMNQYGAYGRAKNGQNYETILNAYYNNVKLECRNFPNNNIKVQGYGEISIYDYLKGIGEMPGSWGNSGGYEALKAQVVAAASYAYSYTNGGSGDICTSESCQVYIGSNKGGKWEEAVNDVKGKCGDGVQVMVSNDTGEVIKAWFASTHGGYVWTSGEIWGSQKPWTKHFQDTTSGANSFSELNERAWDRESPWFYCDWGARAQYNKTAWLKSEEIADMANIIMLMKKDSSVGENLYQVDKPNPAGKETWDFERVKNELSKRGGSPFNNVNSVSVSVDFGTGKTNNVTLSGDAGSQTFDGKEFKDFFNLRAPANIQIVGPLYNVEKH